MLRCFTEPRLASGVHFFCTGQHNRIRIRLHPSHTASPTCLAAATAKAPLQAPTTNTHLITFTRI